MAGGGMDYHQWHSKWKDLPDPLEEEILAGMHVEPDVEAEACVRAAYARELAQEQPADKLHELKVQLAVEAYEGRRPTDKVMHHYWIKEAGDPEAIGEYFPTGDERNHVPVYRNRHGLVLSRERQPMGPDTDQECHGWVIGNMVERRPLYGVQSEDLSAPTLGWETFTAPEPLPTIRYYTHASAARVFKERGTRAFQRRDWPEAEDWYSKSLDCGMDPAEYTEAIGMLLSNRAEVRLRMANFEGAAEDAGNALKLLKAADSFEEPIQLLKQKTVLRLAKAHQSLKRYSDALRLLVEQRRLFPKNQEMERMLEEVQLALKVGGRPGGAVGSGSSGGAASEELLGYVARAVEALQAQVSAVGGGISECAFPEGLAISLRKMEYLLAKAQSVKGSCLSDLQTVVRTCGGMQTLLQVVKAQWSSNLEGKLVDTFKFPGVSSVAVVVSLACDDCPENSRLAAAEAHALFCVLGGCNRKVDVLVCERLVALASHLWEHCRPRTLDLVQIHSIVVEKVAGFLSKAAIAESTDDAAGPDAPAMGIGAKEQAVMLLFELLACGGRVEKRALRGMVPQLAGAEGDGFFTAQMPAARSLGELVAQRALADPALLSVSEVRNILIGLNLLVISGPFADAAERDMATVSYQEYAGEGAMMRYVDLDAWAETEDGQHAALLLQVVARALEFRLLLKGRELERDGFEDAFHAGLGYFATIPLVQAPLPFAEHALLCLSVLAQASIDHVNHIVSLSGINALFGLPSPDSKPMPSHVDQVLKSSPAARRHTAKLLSRCVETQAVLEIMQSAGEKAIKELVKLATQVHKDGKGNLESFHDMLHVFYIISQYRPGPLCRHIPEDMMHLFVDLSSATDQNEVTERAKAIVQMLLRDPACERRLRPILQRREEGRAAYDVEEELLKLQEGPGPLAGLGR